jgi:hypothetical protein
MRLVREFLVERKLRPNSKRIAVPQAGAIDMPIALIAFLELGVDVAGAEDRRRRDIRLFPVAIDARNASPRASIIACGEPWPSRSSGYSLASSLMRRFFVIERRLAVELAITKAPSRPDIACYRRSSLRPSARLAARPFFSAPATLDRRIELVAHELVERVLRRLHKHDAAGGSQSIEWPTPTIAIIGKAGLRRLADRLAY